MKRILIVFPNLNGTVGPPVVLVNMLNKLPREGFEYDLLFISRRKEAYAHLWDRIPKWINILPSLYQLSAHTDELISELRRTSMDLAADVKEKVHSLNANEGIDVFRNWELLKTITPEYSGYDVAVAYTEDIALQIVVDRVSAKEKIGWVHMDYKMEWSDEEIAKRYSLWSKVDTIVCISQQNARVFTECYDDLRERIKIIYNTSDTAYLQRQAGAFYPREYMDNADYVKIFTSGTIGFRKGTDLIIDIVKNLVAEGYKLKWFIAGIAGKGESHKGEECIRKISENALCDSIILLGYKPNPYPYFKNCDIYVHPSRYEGLSTSITEAKILCKPILVTNHSSADEIVTDGETGIICDINAESLTEKLRMMIDNPALCKQLSDNLQKPQESQNITLELEKLFNS